MNRMKSYLQSDRKSYSNQLIRQNPVCGAVIPHTLSRPLIILDPSIFCEDSSIIIMFHSFHPLSDRVGETSNTERYLDESWCETVMIILNLKTLAHDQNQMRNMCDGTKRE